MTLRYSANRDHRIVPHGRSQTFLEARLEICLCRLFGFLSRFFREHEHLTYRLHSDTISDGNYLLAIVFAAYCSFICVYLATSSLQGWINESLSVNVLFAFIYCLSSLQGSNDIGETLVQLLSLKLATYKHCLMLHSNTNI
jgi:hypothetical protein